jgi:uncharacterized repeat protein (TIGR02543 family)
MMIARARSAAIACALSLAFTAALRAQTGRYSSVAVAPATPGFTLNFLVKWSCDDDPGVTSSAAGEVDLVDPAGSVVGSVVATANRAGPVVTATGMGSVSNTSMTMYLYGAANTPADGLVLGTWSVSGLGPGPYTLRFWFNQTSVPGNPLSTITTSTLENGLSTTGGVTPTPTPAPSPTPTPVPTPTPSPTPTPTPTSAPFVVLSLYASSGGSVSGGGSYPRNAQATAVATPSQGYVFAGWTGDLAASTPVLSVTMSSNVSLTAGFSAMLAQTISFVPPASVSARSGSFALAVSASSGLPVTLALNSGPVSLASNLVTPNGSAGQVAVTATQAGNSQYLPAPPVVISFAIGEAPPGVIFADDSAATKRSDRATRVTSYLCVPSH